jgi:hypothetical protein
LVEAVFDVDYLEDSNKLMNLASLYLLHDVPYKAATLIEQAMDKKLVKKTNTNLDRLGQARQWQQ